MIKWRGVERCIHVKRGPGALHAHTHGWRHLKQVSDVSGDCGTNDPANLYPGDSVPAAGQTSSEKLEIMISMIMALWEWGEEGAVSNVSSIIGSTNQP